MKNRPSTPRSRAATAQPAAQSAQLIAKAGIGLELAKKMAALAEAEARKNQWNVVIAIVDDGGNLVLLQKMDGTQLGSIEVATQKALTALRFKRPTRAFEDVIAGGRHALLTLPGPVMVEGGVPLMVDGACVGAIGISGLTSVQDGIVAQAGLAAFGQT